MMSMLFHLHHHPTTSSFLSLHPHHRRRTTQLSFPSSPSRRRLLSSTPYKPSFSSLTTAAAAATPHSPQPTNFPAAVALIVGTAVGPGILALPSTTIRSGPIPSTLAILLSWLYVISSIILVADLTFSQSPSSSPTSEVTFTTLAATAFGPTFGALVAVVYALLSFALIVACVSGIGSILPSSIPPFLAYSLIPLFIGAVIAFLPFAAIDATNRLLCALMLLSITALLTIGISVGRSSLLGSLTYMNFSPGAVLPAIPVTVLTLGFHVITPFVCKMVGDRYAARRAILIGGAVPLLMVLWWNFVVLGMAGIGEGGAAAAPDPIKLLLSVNSAALPAVQGFAFTALATSLIGYSVSFPKQLADTMLLIVQRFGRKEMVISSDVMQFPAGNSSEGGRVGFAVYSRGKMVGSGEACFAGLNREATLETHGGDTSEISSSNTNRIMWGVLILPVFIASFFQAAFSKALDFAGVYANCFLFGVLPPAMAWIHRSRKRSSSTTFKEDLLPGGNAALIFLFSIAVILGFWH